MRNSATSQPEGQAKDSHETDHLLQQLPLTHPLRLDLDAALSRLTDTQARLAATTATLDATVAKLFTTENQLHITEARLEEKEDDYIDLEDVNRHITSMLNKTKENYLSLLRKNERLRKERDTLKTKTSSDDADADDDDTPSGASIPEMNSPSLSAPRPPSPYQPVQTLEELVLVRDYNRLYSDILQITLHPALCIGQKTLGPSSFEKASFYDPATWDSLSPAARNLRIRGSIFDLVAKHLLLGSDCRADLVHDWSPHRASVEGLASFQKLMISDAGSKLSPPLSLSRSHP